MKRLLRRLIVFASALGLMMALNVGAAFADHPGPAFDDANAIADGGGPPPAAAAETPGAIPVGTALGFNPALPQDQQGHAGLRNSQGFGNLARNPNCPLHYQS